MGVAFSFTKIMKKYFIQFFILIDGIISATAFAQSNAGNYKGIYVDGFDKILGNKVKEDSLLNYCKSNGFNALTTYRTKDIEKKIHITNPKTGGKTLASFIKRAKNNYGIISFAMSSEQYQTFKNVVYKYNASRKDTSERVNVFNFEFEYWNRHSTAVDGYYCKKYLKPSGCSCDTAGAFKFYRKQMKSIDSLAAKQHVKSEVYVGKPTAGQALVIANTVDRVLVDIYLKDPAKAYNRSTDRLTSFGEANKKITIIPIWGSTDEFMGEWQNSHQLSDADKQFMKDFDANKNRQQQNLTIAGFQWYKYSTMKK